MSLNDLQPGDQVRTWTGGIGRQPGPVLTVERLTATQIITTNGLRWKRSTGIPVGDRSFRPPFLIRVDDPRLLASEAARVAKEQRARTAGHLRAAADWWVNHPDSERTAALRAAVVAVAPFLGLTVTMDADRCTYHDGDLPCLLPATHVTTGQWHAGLGWVASLTDGEG